MSYLVIDLKEMKMYPVEHLDIDPLRKRLESNAQSIFSSIMNEMTENIPMLHIYYGATINNYFASSSNSNPLHASDEKIKETLLALLEATDDDGNRIFTEKSQWYAVYKVLSECHGYPTKISEFCDIMKNWGMDGVTPACTYDSVKKVPSQVKIPTPKVTLWQHYKDKADDKFKKQVIVAMKLIKMLEE